MLIVHSLQHLFAFVYQCYSFVFLQSFTRVTELVLQAHKRDVDTLLGSLDDYLEKAALEEERGGRDDSGAQRACTC